MKPYLIIGLGNPLMGDDGAGPRVVELLVGIVPPERLRTMITPGFDMVTYLQDAETVVLVDAADFGGEPGELRTAEPDGLTAVGKSDTLGFHGTDLMRVLDFAREHGLLPRRVLLYLVQKRAMEPGTGMCPAVGRGVRAAVEKLKVEVIGNA